MDKRADLALSLVVLGLGVAYFYMADLLPPPRGAVVEPIGAAGLPKALVLRWFEASQPRQTGGAGAPRVEVADSDSKSLGCLLTQAVIARSPSREGRRSPDVSRFNPEIGIHRGGQ